MGGKRDVLPKYESVIRFVRRRCESIENRNNRMDKVQSGIIFALWTQGGFDWDWPHIRNFVNQNIRWSFKFYRKTALACEVEDLDDEDSLDKLYGKAGPTQETYVEAQMALRLLRFVDPKERLALLILADGGSPLDVADELGCDAIGAMLLIRRGREKIRAVVGEGENEERRAG